VTRLEVGRVGRAHGLRGEVVVKPITNRSERFQKGAELFLDDDRTVTIASSRPLKDTFVVRFDGVDDRNGAEALRGKVLTAAPIEGDDDALWAHDVIGAEVHDRAGAVLGRVVAVEANPAHDLLVLDNDALVPVVFVVSHSDGVIVVDPPEGLLE
jgi:16S rRNA processing protein RimM